VVLYVRCAWVGALFWTLDDAAGPDGTSPRQSLLVKPLPEVAVNFRYILPQLFCRDLAFASEFRRVGTHMVVADGGSIIRRGIQGDVPASIAGENPV
jgi:hypothetical protein